MERFEQSKCSIEQQSDDLIHNCSKFCDDLVVEILCRLPAEILIRFKSVCKLWNRLITDVCVPNFTTFARCSGYFYLCQFYDRGHYRGQQLKYASLYNRCPSADERVIKSLSALLPFKFCSENFVHCCNGLLLFSSYAPQYYVCNPLTKQCIEIPKYLKHKNREPNAALAFDPRESLHYRVVCFNYFSRGNLTADIDIFSSEMGCWVNHIMPVVAQFSGVPMLRCAVYLQGILYRLFDTTYLLQFDLNKLNVSALEVPKLHKPDAPGFIGVSKDCLHFTNCQSKGCVNSKIFVWFLEDRSSWVLKYSICIDDLCRFNLYHPLTGRTFCCKYSTFAKPLAFDPNAEAIFFGCWGGILRYEVGNGTLKLLHPLEQTSAYPHYFFTYVPCLVIFKDISSRALLQAY